jgi:hypothetical protein
MKMLNVCAVLMMVFLTSGCAVQEYRTYQHTQREAAVASAVHQAKQGIAEVSSDSLMPAQYRNCALGPAGVSVAGTNRSYDVTYNASQACEAQKTRQGGVGRPQGLDSISLEECVAVNFSVPQCAKYGQPVAGGTR